MSLEDTIIKSVVNILSKPECMYTSCYCEENVWMLCNKVKQYDLNLLSSSSVLFISNPQKSVPIWKQRSQISDVDPVIWDYHVVMLSFCPNVDEDKENYYIYDLDSTLPFPSLLSVYIKNALKSDSDLIEKYHRFLKVIPAKDYLNHFASDRSHMKLADGQWLATPPSYPCISTENCKMNLNEYLNMDAQTSHETVYSLTDFQKCYNVL